MPSQRERTLIAGLLEPDIDARRQATKMLRP